MIFGGGRGTCNSETFVRIVKDPFAPAASRNRSTCRSEVSRSVSLRLSSRSRLVSMPTSTKLLPSNNNPCGASIWSETGISSAWDRSKCPAADRGSAGCCGPLRPAASATSPARAPRSGKLDRTHRHSRRRKTGARCPAALPRGRSLPARRDAATPRCGGACCRRGGRLSHRAKRRQAEGPTA